MEMEEPKWILKTVNPGDSCFYVEGGFGNSYVNLTSDPVTALFEAPADSVFFGSNTLKRNTNIESVIQYPKNIISLSNHCFGQCSKLTSINLPKTITSLGYSCFYECTSLTSVIIPGSVVLLNTQCFIMCNKLTSITFNGIIEPTFGSNALYNVPTRCVIHVPSNYNGTTFGGRTVTKDLPAV